MEPKIRPMETNLMRRSATAEATRGAVLLLNSEIDLVRVAFAAMRKSLEPDRAVISPVEAAVLGCFVMARGQVGQMIEEQGRAEISEEAQMRIVKTLVRELLEEYLMMSLEECSD